MTKHPALFASVGLLLSLTAFAADPVPGTNPDSIQHKNSDIIGTVVVKKLPMDPAKYAGHVTRLAQDRSYIQSAKSTDYWEIAPYYVSQFNPKACSVASVTTVLNALRANDALTSKDELFTQESVQKLGPKFAKAVGRTGKGMTLDELGPNFEALVKKALPQKNVSVETVRFNGSDAAAELKKLEALLEQSEKNAGKDFVIANFLQATLTGDPEGVGHISTIGAYDSRKKRVLIMDTDRQYYEPYWVPVETFMKAMNEVDSGAKKARGLIVIRAQ